MSRFAISIVIVTVLTGCGSATEPRNTEPSSEYSGWVGTWVGTNGAQHINLQIQRGIAHETCWDLGRCADFSDLHYTVTFSDASAGYSRTTTSVFETNPISVFLWDLAPGEVLFDLFSADVIGRPGVTWAWYTYKGKLQGSTEASGNVVVGLMGPGSSLVSPLSTELSAMTLHKQ